MAAAHPIGFYPFWFWNARMEPAEIEWQIAEMAAQGVRGFYVHSRQGLEQPYLSDSFFAALDCAIAAAERHDLEVHLYDEFPYPTGAAGGETMLGNPEHMATRLVQRHYDVPGGPLRQRLPAGQVLSVRAVPRRADGTLDFAAERDLRSATGMSAGAATYSEMGLTDYNRKRFLSCDPAPTVETTLPPGEWRVYATVQEVVTGMKYWGSYIDTLNPATIQRFLELTHERYAARYGGLFGTRIPSIFVDEIAPHWSRLVPAAFREHYGYELLDHLTALQEPAHPRHVQTARDLAALELRMFEAAFDIPVGAWCREHGIMIGVEKPTKRLSQFRHADLPGCDCGHTKAGRRPHLFGHNPRDNVKAVASAAYFYDKPGCLDECYHSIGWSGTLQDAKLLAEGMVMLGITHLVPHGFFYSSHGLRKHDAPPSFFFQMPYWPHWGHLSQRIDRLGTALHGSWEDAEVLVVEPGAGLPGKPEYAAFMALQDALVDRHIGFYLVDTDILESGTAADGVLHVKDLSVRAIVVPPMPAPEPALLAVLAACEAAGVTVLRCPLGAEPAVALATLDAVVEPHLSITATDATRGDDDLPPETPGVWTVRRVSRADGSACHVVLNTTAVPVSARLNARGAALREEPLDPALPPLLERDVDPRTGEACWLRVLAPFESLLLHEVPAPAAAAAEPLPTLSIALDGPATLRPLQPNLLRLARFAMVLLDADGQPTGPHATVDAFPLLHQLRDGKLPFAPTLRQGFGTPAEIGLPLLHVRYAADIYVDALTPAQLVMEPDSIVGDWTLRLNDGPALGPADFAPTTAHVRGSLAVDLAPWLRTGPNTLVVEVRTDRPDGGLLNPLYLAGDFGVYLRSGPPRLGPRPATGRFEAWDANGLPHYAGVIEYERDITLPPAPAAGPVLLAFTSAEPFRDALEVALNDGPWHPVLWEPRLLQIDAAELRPGANRLRLRVATALLRAFEGERFNEHLHRAEPLATAADLDA